MKIKHISTAVMEANFDWTIVKVETDDHVTGYGEAFLGPGLTAVIRKFGEILVGEDATSIDRGCRPPGYDLYSPGIALRRAWAARNSSRHRGKGRVRRRGTTTRHARPSPLVGLRSIAVMCSSPRGGFQDWERFAVAGLRVL